MPELLKGKSLLNQELLVPDLIELEAQNILKHLWQSIKGSDGSEQTTWLHTNHLGAFDSVMRAGCHLNFHSIYQLSRFMVLLHASAFSKFAFNTG